MRKAWKKVLALVLALAMVIPGVALGGSEGKEVQAVAGTESVNGVVLPVGQVNKDGAVPTPNVEAYKGWLFAGWFKDSNCTLDDVPENEDEKLFAKFVPADVLSTKAQATKADSGNDVIRFVSSVESLNYSKVGFEVSWEGKKPLKNTSSTVFKKIKTTTAGADYEFGPKVMDIESEYFITAKLDLKAEPFKSAAKADTDFLVRAFWTTLDGITVYGASRCISLNDGRGVGNTVNMSFELTDGLKADTLKKDGVEEGEDPYVGLYVTNSTDTAKIITVDGTTVHVRVSTNKTALKSATYFEFTKDEEGKEVVGSTVYRNLYTEYKGPETADRSWYDAYVKDAKQTDKKDFLIVTNADLYGFAEIVNATDDDKRDSFYEKTVYLAADIKANEGTAEEEQWDGTGGTSYEWTSIGRMNDSDSKKGNPFKGTFDGDGHTISGIYLNQTQNDGTNVTYASGLFGYTVDSKIKNLKLENSYMYSNGLGLGSIVGYGEGDLINIYSSANLKSSDIQVGGLVGRVQDGIINSGADGFKAANCNITNCWYDGNIKLTSSSTDLRGGGLIGNHMFGTLKINNSLFTGAIRSVNGQYIGGLVGRQGGSNTQAEITNSASMGVVEGKISGAVYGYAVATTTVRESVYVSTADVAFGSGTGTNVTPTSLDFTSAGTFAQAEAALNAGVETNNSGSAKVIWDAWEEYNGQLVLKSLDPEKPIIIKPDTNWRSGHAGTEADPYLIFDAADLYGLAAYSHTNALASKVIKLASNIKVNYGNANEWGEHAPVNPWETTIGGWIGDTKLTNFMGIFDGDERTISGIYMKTDEQYAGLFGVTWKQSTAENGIVKNLRLENSYFENTGTGDVVMGSIAGQGGGAFQNVYSDAILVSNGRQVGGLIGQANRGVDNTYNIENCWFNGEIHMIGAEAYNAGGIVGVVTQGTANIKNCLNTGLITSERTEGVNVGGICGVPANAAVVNITNCVNAGPFEILNDVAVGAMIGRNGTSEAEGNIATVTVIHSYITGDGYQAYTVGRGGTGQLGEKSEEAAYEADAATLAKYLNADGVLWTVRTVNGIEIPVLSSLQDVLD